MRQLRAIVLCVLTTAGGVQCDTETCAENWNENPYYLQIENLTEESVQIEFHEAHDGISINENFAPAGLGREFFFVLAPGKVKTVYFSSSSDGSLAEQRSLLPMHPFNFPGGYDSLVVVVGNRREVFFGTRLGRESPYEWKSIWNVLSISNWNLIEEPRSLCEPTDGDWLYRASLRAK